MGRIALRIALVGLILGLGCSTTWAQEQSGQQSSTSQKPKDTRATPATPIQPLATGTAPAAGQSAGQAQTATSDQSQSLSGAEQYLVSSMRRSHSYFIPIFQVSQSGDTNGLKQFGSTQFESVSTVSGALAFNHVWSRYNFMADYAGTGFLYNRDLSLSSSAHAFSLTQTITGARSNLLLTDAVSYLPEAAFGYERFGGLNGFNAGFGGMFGVPTAGLNGVYIPNQSILGGNSSRISNAAVGQYDYNLSPFSSLTFVGSYGLLRFPDTNFIDSNQGVFGVGFNHAINRRDTVAVTYLGSIFRYDEPDNNFTAHVVALVYGHRISQLLALRFGAGPQVNTFSSNVNGNTNVTWYATASLDYHLPRTRLSLGYTHYTTAGAGVFVGAETDTMGVTLGRQITRMWSGEMNMGYSRNKALQVTSGSPIFNTWYASANLQRPLGRYMGLFLSYNLQQQSSNNPLVPFYSDNFFSVGFNWHPRSVEVGQ